MQEPDLHHYDRKLKSQVKSVRNAKISERNKDLIFEFQRYCVVQGLSKPRIMTTSNYMLIDADRDGDVDAIIPNGGRPLVVPSMKEYIKERDKCFDMYGFSVALPEDLQTSATRTLNGVQEPSLLEAQLMEFRKKK